MNEFYSSFLNSKDLSSNSNEYSSKPPFGWRTSTKQMGFALLFFISLLGSFSSIAQTVLINPATDGGFESGATFAANGWTVSNSANNPWVIGTAVAVTPIAGNSAYISNDAGVSNLYTPADNATNYFYRDVVIPAGETKINLSFSWNSKGENSYDLWQVFYAPTTVIPVGTATHPGSGTSNVPAGISGATFIGNSSVTTGVQSANYFLPASLAGTTVRLIFSWKNEVGGTQPPASIDNISLTSAMPGNYVSIASGNWSAPSTWNLGSVPTILDNATIAAGTTVSVDAANLSTQNLTVNGVLDYTATPTSFTVANNLTVETSGTLNAFNGVAGKTLSVGGNITNNGLMNFSVGSTSSGNLTLNGSALQTVSGTGSFTNNVIRNLVFTNTSTSIPNINWQLNNISVEYNLNIANAKINLGANKLTHGVSILIHTTTGTFTTTNGGFTSGTFSRWWSPLATGYTTLNPTAIQTAQGGRYPFINSLGQARVMYIGRTTPVNGGQYAVTYTDAMSISSGLSIIDDAYTVTDRFNGKFVVSTEGTTPSATSYVLTLFAPDAYFASSANSRIIGLNSAISGTHQATYNGAASQRSGVSEADLLSTTGLYLGLNATDLIFTSVGSGAWNNATTWNKGTVPTCSDVVIIASGNTVTSSGAGNVSKGVTVLAGATLEVTGGDITVGCTANNNAFVNNGTLTVSAGVLNVNGSFLHNANSVFNHSGGAINVDGNDAGIAATSVASGTSIVQLNSNLLNWTGGTLTIVDPHAATTLSNSFAYSNAANVNASGTHVIRFGNGTSDNIGGNVLGFRSNTWVGSGRVSFNDLVINGGAGDNRLFSSNYAFGVNGNLTINAASRYNDNAIITYVAGNFVNNGIFANTGTLYLGSYLNAVVAPTLIPQTISGSGIFANALTDSTANLKTLAINNTNTTGVTLNLPLTVSSNINLVSGIVNTTSANLLTLGTTTATGVLSGNRSATAMIKGPFAIAIASGNTSLVIFPVGKADYMPISIAPTTTSIAIFKAEAFSANAGTTNSSINALASKRWQVAAISGTYTDIDVKLTEAGIVPTSIPVQGTAAAGIYSNAFGSTATYTEGPPPSTESNTAVLAADFTGFISYANSNVCMGTPNPGMTVASLLTLCNGNSSTLSLQNSTAGTGVTYQWESSADGVSYTAITGATESTFTVTPTQATFYRAQVSCGSNTGTSTAVQITFTNSVLTTTPGAICGLGSAVLQATGSAGSTIGWYANMTGGVALGSGTTFNTPEISTTTTFYAGAEVASPISSILGAGATTSSSTAATFFPGAWGGAKTQYIIKASELNAIGIGPGNITSLGFEPTTSGQTYQGFIVEMGTTTQAAATTTFVGGLSQVYRGTGTDDAFTPVANAVNTLAFGLGTGSQSTFLWNGTSNIVVSISWSRVPSAATSTASGMKVDNVGFVSSNYKQADNITPAAMQVLTAATSTSSNRPRFTINGVGICSSDRVPVIATVNTAPTFTLSDTALAICNGQTTPTATTISVGVTDYDTYVWSPAIGVTGNAATGWNFNPTVTTTFTLIASQSTGSLCSASASVVITVNAVPTSIVIAPMISEVCAGTIVALSATGGNVNNTQILTESFNTATNNWTTTNNSTGTNAALIAWTLNPSPLIYASYGPFSSNDASQFYFSNNDAGGSGSVANTALISPVFSTLNFVDASVSFWHYFRTPGDAKVEYSVNGGTTWTTVQTTTVTTGAPATFVQSNVTLPAGALNQASVQVRFKYDTTGWQYFWAIDNVSISGTQSYPISWTPTTNLYSDAAATVPYAGETSSMVYYKSDIASLASIYTASVTGPFGCTASGTTSVSTIDCGIPYANLQFPGAATITNCGTATFYAQVYKEGVTEAAGQGAGITAWIGTNATNTDPSTWTEASWQVATFNVQSGNNDEYQATFGPLATGTYYVASRFKYAAGNFVYGGYEAPPSGGGIWNGTSNISAVLTVETPAPIAADQVFCNVGTVADLTATGTGLQWYADATGGTALAGTTALATGNYYVSQTIDGCESLRTMVGVTVNVTAAPTAEAQSFCNVLSAATVADLMATGTGLQWYADATGGTALEVTTALTSGNYYVSQTIAGCESGRTMVAVTINVTAAPTASTQTLCMGETVASLIASGTGLQWYNFGFGGDALASTTVLISGDYYVSQTVNGCESARTMVSVILNSSPAIATQPISSSVCPNGTVTLSVVATGTDLTYQWFKNGVLITSATSATYSILAAALSDAGDYTVTVSGSCSPSVTSATAVVSILNTAAPTGVATQDFTAGDTLASFTVNGQNIIWYSASTDGTVLPSTTLIVSGTTYYASQTLNGCESMMRLAVTAGIDLKTPSFEISNLRYYPNPVQSILTVEYSDTIDAVQMYNMLGQLVYNRNTNASKVTIEMTSMVAGNYILQVTVKGITKNVKVIKK